MNEYLTTKELSQRIKIARQTLYNKKYQGEFQQGVHFLQPSPKKTLWIWQAMIEWLEKSSQHNRNASGKAESIRNKMDSDKDDSISEFDSQDRNGDSTPNLKSAINI